MKLITILCTLLIISSCSKHSAVEIENFFGQLNILTIKKQTIVSNILNQNTTRTESGGPYIPVKATNCKHLGCDITPLSDYGIGANKNSKREPILKYEPNHPDAKTNGYVAYPNINIEEEKMKLKRVQLAIKFLLKEMPVAHSYFFSKESQAIFEKFPALSSEYNFKLLLEQ